jgi:hypothetical protein
LFLKSKLSKIEKNIKNFSIMNKLKAIFFIPIILVKFFVDSRYLKIKWVHWKIYRIIHLLTLRWNDRFPDLINPKSFNDKIQWLKLFDQSWSVVHCTDKILMKNYVYDVLGDGFTPKLLAKAEDMSGVNLNDLPSSFVLKTNHDSGSVFIVKDKSDLDWGLVCGKVEKSLLRMYGWRNGEWNYSLIKPMVFVEEYLPGLDGAPPADYKFHCSNGEVLWLQYIYDRGINTKEVIVSPDGDVIDLQLDDKMLHSKKFELPDCFAQMKSVAMSLSREFKYVRVDLYLVGGRIYVGELTFYPAMGCYKGEGQQKLGDLLNFDMNNVKDPIYMASSRY